MLSDNLIAIIDYQMGNLRSVCKALEQLGARPVITHNPETLSRADKIILPGVGAFKDGMQNLAQLNLVHVLNDLVLNQEKPFLGICLGMQIICQQSEENGLNQGLGWIDANVIKFRFTNKTLKVPHVGWNNICYAKPSPLFDGIPNNSDFYFVHTYHLQTNNTNIITGTTDYGYPFVSSVQKGHIYACQFHPEKSQKPGLQLLQNFLNL